MGKNRIDTRTIGLEVGCAFAKWLTGAENLHYGLWTGLEVNAGNLGAAQAAYTEKLFSYLPDAPLSILDIGGGAGETARKLIALGHAVQIVVPSPFLADRCRANAPEATVHLTTFEDFETNEKFDLCLFSESFQYIPLEIALDKAMALTKPRGHILIADCFRSENVATDGEIRPPGGGHSVVAFRESITALPVEEIAQEDITAVVAPSIDLEQSLFHVFGVALDRIDAELILKKPGLRRIFLICLKVFGVGPKMKRIDARLRGDYRTSTSFTENNRYLISLLRMSA